MKMKSVILGVNNPRCYNYGGNGHIGKYCKNGKSNNDSNNNNNKDSNNNNRQYNCIEVVVEEVEVEEDIE